MKLWVAGLVLFVFAILLTVVCLLLVKSKETPRSGWAPLVKPPAPESKPMPVETGAEIQRDTILALLEKLIQAVRENDLELKSKVQDDLRAFGLPAVEVMRVDVLGNTEGWHRDHRYHVAVQSTILSMASPEVGAELLHCWSEVDQGRYEIPGNAVGLRLSFFTETIIRSPPVDAGKRLIDLYTAATTTVVKRSLIELMGALLAKFPALREFLLKIMKEDPVAQLKGIAATALVAHDPMSVMPEIQKVLSAILDDPADRGGQELEGLMKAILKALPFDQAMDAVKKIVKSPVEDHQVGKLNSMGFALGMTCGAPGDPSMELMLARAPTENSDGMKFIYLGALAGAVLNKNGDTRLTDLALRYLNEPGSVWLRSHALAMVNSLNRDEATVLGAFDHAWKAGGKLSFFAAGQLKFHLTRDPANVAGLERMRAYLSTGSIETRLQVLKGLRWGSGGLPSSVVDQLEALSKSDPDESIRLEASKTLKNLGLSR